MTPTICFDALGTCFSVDPLVDALEELLGKELRDAGSGARMVVMDWFHSAQRDYTVCLYNGAADQYLSITSPPPPPISKILTLTLPRSLTYALRSFPSLTTSPLPDLSPVLGRLKSLTPSPGLETGFRLLKAEGARVLIITNGSKGTTEEYVRQAGLVECVDGVQSCDEIGMGKPFGQVYEAATQLCEQTSGREGERWFVAAHMWDVCAARKAGFKTGAVLSEQPPLGNEELDQWWELWGGKPDVIGMDLEEVARGIIASSTSR